MVPHARIAIRAVEPTEFDSVGTYWLCAVVRHVASISHSMRARFRLAHIEPKDAWFADNHRRS